MIAGLAIRTIAEESRDVWRSTLRTLAWMPCRVAEAAVPSTDGFTRDVPRRWRYRIAGATLPMIPATAASSTRSYESLRPQSSVPAPGSRRRDLLGWRNALLESPRPRKARFSPHDVLKRAIAVRVEDRKSVV